MGSNTEAGEDESRGGDLSDSIGMVACEVREPGRTSLLVRIRFRRNEWIKCDVDDCLELRR